MHVISTNKLLFFATLLFFSFCVAETDNRTKEPYPSVNISPIFTPNYNPTFTNHAPTIKNNPQFINYVYSLSYAVGMKIKDVTIVWFDYIKKKATPENYNLVRDAIKKILWQNRYKIAGSTALGSYSATSILLLSDYHSLNCSSTWARWKYESSFEDLCSISQKDLARELLLGIGQRYYNDKNPTDLAHPLVQFLNIIDAEIKTIKRYITTTKIIKQLRLISIFPTNDSKIAHAQKLLERTLFIKHIFLSWLSEYNIAQSYKC